MTIEQKALKLWGSTRDPECAIWILPDGVLINGCQQLPGQRDVDHSEIGQFFKPSKFQDPGSNYIYIRKFVRRGNIRMSMDGSTFHAQFYKNPTPAQVQALLQCLKTARRLEKPCELDKLDTKLFWQGQHEIRCYLTTRFGPEAGTARDYARERTA